VFTDHSLFGFADAASINVNKYLKFTLSNIDHCICVSHTDRENLVLRAALDPRIVSAIPNAVDARKFEPDPSARPASNRINVVMLSRLVYRKGIDLVVNVIPAICAKFPHVNFIIGGDGPKKLLLEEMRERHQLHDRVELLGAVPHKHVRDVLTRGHIFLNCSLTEAFCIAILEAACCGCFVVSTRVGGVPEVLPLHMIRFAEPDPESLVTALTAAIPLARYHDPADFHAELRASYNWPDVAQRTLRVYHAVVAAPRPPLIERFRRYFGVGRVFGPIAVIAMALFHFMWQLLELVAPAADVDVVPDLPAHLMPYLESTDTMRAAAAAASRPNVVIPPPQPPPTDASEWGGWHGAAMGCGGTAPVPVAESLHLWTPAGVRPAHVPRRRRGTASSVSSVSSLPPPPPPPPAAGGAIAVTAPAPPSPSLASCSAGAGDCAISPPATAGVPLGDGAAPAAAAPAAAPTDGESLSPPSGSASRGVSDASGVSWGAGCESDGTTLPPRLSIAEYVATDADGTVLATPYAVPARATELADLFAARSAGRAALDGRLDSMDGNGTGDEHSVAESRHEGEGDDVGVTAPTIGEGGGGGGGGGERSERRRGSSRATADDMPRLLPGDDVYIPAYAGMTLKSPLGDVPLGDAFRMRSRGPRRASTDAGASGSGTRGRRTSTTAAPAPAPSTTAGNAADPAV